MNTTDLYKRLTELKTELFDEESRLHGEIASCEVWNLNTLMQQLYQNRKAQETVKEAIQFIDRVVNMWFESKLELNNEQEKRLQ